MTVPIVLVAAMARNRVIGADNGLPWRMRSDMKHFKAATMGKPLVMGRKTWQSIGRPLPGRRTIVVTRDPAFAAEGVDIAGSLEAGLDRGQVLAREMGADAVIVAGGAAIYAQALPLADRLHVTHVLAAIDGDAHFPPIDPDLWHIVRFEDIPAGEKDSHATRYSVYERRRDVH